MAAAQDGGVGCGRRLSWTRSSTCHWPQGTGAAGRQYGDIKGSVVYGSCKQTGTGSMDSLGQRINDNGPESVPAKPVVAAGTGTFVEGAPA